ncbi:WYL domain-containing protein [Chloroflexi bacterium TSY]|nr:WYL domain-containing protein [Chloroflexi bacterium TSY]
MLPKKNIPLQRTFSLIRCLQRGPANKMALAEFVHDECEVDEYGLLIDKPDKKRFENDMQRIRDLGAEYEHDPSIDEYQLLTFGEFTPAYLSEEELETVAFLRKTFGPGAPNSEQVQTLLHHLIGMLPERQQVAIHNKQRRLGLDLRRKDTARVLPAVQAVIDRAVGERRIMRFAYLSPSQADSVPRVHTVQPWEYFFDTTRGHFYIDGYRLQVEGPYGIWKKETWQKYRPERILPDEIAVLGKLPPTPPRRPRYELEYLLAPEIARLGEISRHFDAMQIHETNADGWTRVTGHTGDLFMAVRQLLGYGAGCKVLGGEEARWEMRAMVEKMAKNYSEEEE